MESATGKELFNVDLPRTQQIVFSPRDRLLATCEPYVVYVAKTVSLFYNPWTTNIMERPHCYSSSNLWVNSFFHFFKEARVYMKM